jgi:hypothetical protein
LIRCQIENNHIRGIGGDGLHGVAVSPGIKYLTECGAPYPEDSIEPKVPFVGPTHAGEDQTGFGATQKVTNSGRCISKEVWVVSRGARSVQFDQTSGVDFAISNPSRNDAQRRSDCCQNDRESK